MFMQFIKFSLFYLFCLESFKGCLLVQCFKVLFPQLYQLILTERFHAHCVAQNLSSLVRQYNITSVIFVSPHPSHFPYMYSKQFSVVTWTYIQRNKFDDTIFFIVVTSVQCVEVTHGPLCLLRSASKPLPQRFCVEFKLKKE